MNFILLFMIQGENIYLRLMEIEDVRHKVNWINNSGANKSFLFDYPSSQISTEHWLRKAVLDSSRKDFIVCLKSNHAPIGYCGLINIDIKNLKAESYLHIERDEYWTEGYGYELSKALLLYAFDDLGLNKIYSFHMLDHEEEIKVALKVGGKKEGTLPEDIFFKGVLKDRMLVSVLKSEILI